MNKLVTLALLAGAVACGSSGGVDVDAAPPNPALPTWTLEDIQPQSPRFGEVYGLDAFSGEVLVALLANGF